MARILFVSTSTTVGGAEKTLFSLATLLDPKRFTTAGVVSLKPFGPYAHRLQELGVKTTTLELKGRPGPAQLKELCRVIRHERPDVVHALMYQAIQFCRLAKRRLAQEAPFKLISSPRVSYRTRSAFTLLVDGVLKGQDDMLVAESGATRDYLVRRLGYDARKVRVIYNGVDLANVPPSKLERQKKRLELRLGADEALIGCVGRLDAQKGHSALFEAMAKLRRRRRARLVVLGDGPKRAELEAQIRRLQLEGTVLMLGETKDVAGWLSSLEVFALPSLWEGLPNALLEAMALGVPCVASSVDGVPEVIQDGENGLLVPPGEPEALARALGRLLDDAELRARLGAAARQAIGSKFSIIGMMAAYEQAYQDVLKG